MKLPIFGLNAPFSMPSGWRVMRSTALKTSCLKDVISICMFGSHARLMASIGVLLFVPPAMALDKSGNFESKQEQDAFIASTLKKMAGEINAQAPIPVDEETKLISTIALQKTITFNMRIPKYKSFEVDPKDINQIAKENLNHTVCKSAATRNLIDLGVQYVYLYSGSDGKLITRLVIDKYRC